jgi:thioredoxin 1
MSRRLGTVGAFKKHMKTVIEIQGDEFERAIPAAAKPVLAHFYTSWCGQCRILAPSLEILAGELEGELQVAKVNLDHCPELAKRYGIIDVPTLIFFDNGVPIASLDAWMSPRQMEAQLHGLLADYATPSLP